MTDVDMIQNDEMSFYTANIAILATFEKAFFFTEKRLGKLENNYIFSTFRWKVHFLTSENYTNQLSITYLEGNAKLFS